MLSEQLGFCRPGDAVGLLRDGVTALDGRMPINPSGGLLSKGHPIGATGAAQLVELADQMRGAFPARAQKEGACFGPRRECRRLDRRGRRRRLRHHPGVHPALALAATRGQKQEGAGPSGPERATARRAAWRDSQASGASARRLREMKKRRGA